MKTIRSVMRGAIVLGAIASLGCSKGTDTNGVVASAMAAERHGETKASADSSPFVVGVWKFVPGAGGTPTIDTEFRFINPTTVTATLEYAFFELDGTFCGCDRDDFPPNHTTIYTILDETKETVKGTTTPLFTCTGTSGALKSITFIPRKHDRISVDDTAQVGFQTHAFGGVVDLRDRTLTGSVMTEAPLQGIALSDSTLNEVRAVHARCVEFLGPIE